VVDRQWWGRTQNGLLDEFSLEKPTAQPRLEVRFLAMGTGAEAIVRPARQQAMGEERDAPVTRYGVGAGGRVPDPSEYGSGRTRRTNQPDGAKIGTDS
jgi:hypothetical protein